MLCYAMICKRMGRATYVSISGIHYPGFGLGSVYRVSMDWTCAGSQMTLWSDEDLIREKPASLTQVFFVLLALEVYRRQKLKMKRG